MIAVLLYCTGIGVYLGSAVVARHRAQATADLAALTAGARLPAGTAAACAGATAVAHAMHVDTVQCEAERLDIIVRVDVASVFAGTAHAAARAGPIAAGP